MITAAAILSVCLMSQIDEQTVENLRPQVSQLIKALEADERDDRDAAEKRLISIGIPVLELLPQTDDNFGPIELATALRSQDAVPQGASRVEQRPGRSALGEFNAVLLVVGVLRHLGV